ncbi:MAG: hypothetical protein EOO90_09310 [Pedobacter sp.]|nr:MAG: hypothetical protein EOO90_09310 [Pedobacter sp.]
MTGPFYLLFIFSIPVACIAWTVTKEEVFREPREFCVDRSRACKKIWQRKFFYLFTCEYCFSHYIAIAILLITDYRMVFEDWRGYFISGFSLVWIANVYMSIYNLIRIDLKKNKIIAEKEEIIKEKVASSNPE